MNRSNNCIEFTPAMPGAGPASMASFPWTSLGSRKSTFRRSAGSKQLEGRRFQAFYGALAGQRATKGVFITTSGYTLQALEFARSVERIVLVDGARLAELMIDHQVGVSSRTLFVPKLDSDYFDEESA